MNKFLLLWLAMRFACTASAQDYVAMGNQCYDEKNYPCALENYKVAFKTPQLVKADNMYLLTFRIGFCHRMLRQNDSASVYLHLSRTTRPDHMLSWYNLGLLNYDLRKYDSAIYFLNQTLPMAEKTSQYNYALMYLGMSYDRAVKQKEARESFRKITERKDDFLEIDLEIGESFAKQTLWDSAIIQYHRAAQYILPAQTKAFTRMHRIMANAYRGKGARDTAITLLQDALKKSPNNGTLHWELGITYASAKRYPEAIGQYEKALPMYSTDTSNSYTLLNNIHACYLFLQDYSKAASFLSQAIQYNRNTSLSADLSKLMVYQAAPLGNLEQAIRTAQRLMEVALAEKDTAFSLNRERRSKAWVVKAMHALQKKDTTQALQFLTMGKGLTPGSIDIATLLGDIYWNRNDKTTAGELYKQGTSTVSRDTLLTPPTAYARQQGRIAAWYYAKDPNNNGFILQKHVEEALKYDSLQKEAVEAWPAALSANSIKFNQHYLACQLLHDKALKLYANDKPYVARLWNNKAVMYNIKKDSAQVIPALQKSIAADIDYMQAWGNLFRVLTQYNRHAEGVLQADKLIAHLSKKKQPQELASALIFKGDFLWRLNKKTEAKAAYAEAQVHDPENATVKNRLLMQ